jgi:amidase
VDVLFGSAADAAALLRRKEISARELTELQLARVDAVNPAVNAVVELRREAALRTAPQRRRTRRSPAATRWGRCTACR